MVVQAVGDRVLWSDCIDEPMPERSEAVPNALYGLLPEVASAFLAIFVHMEALHEQCIKGYVGDPGDDLFTLPKTMLDTNHAKMLILSLILAEGYLGTSGTELMDALVEEYPVLEEFWKEPREAAGAGHFHTALKALRSDSVAMTKTLMDWATVLRGVVFMRILEYLIDTEYGPFEPQDPAIQELISVLPGDTIELALRALYQGKAFKDSKTDIIWNYYTWPIKVFVLGTAKRADANVFTSLRYLTETECENGTSNVANAKPSYSEIPGREIAKMATTQDHASGNDYEHRTDELVKADAILNCIRLRVAMEALCTATKQCNEGVTQTWVRFWNFEVRKAMDQQRDSCILRWFRNENKDQEYKLSALDDLLLARGGGLYEKVCPLFHPDRKTGRDNIDRAVDIWQTIDGKLIDIIRNMYEQQSVLTGAPHPSITSDNWRMRDRK